MRHIPTNDPDDDFMVEITSLDTPTTSKLTNNETLQEVHMTPQVRRWLTIFSVAGCLLLIFVVLSPVLSSLLLKKTTTAPTSHLLPTQITNVTIQNRIAYVTASDGSLQALSTKNGSLLWQRNLGEMTPLFVNNTIYITSYRNLKFTVQALSAINGTVLWTFNTSQDITPLIIDNGTVYTLFQSFPQGHILIALDSRSGAQLWHYTMNTAQLQNAYIQGMLNKIYIIIWSNTQKSYTDLFVLKMSNGSLLWHIEAENIQFIQENLIFVSENKGPIHVLNADNGHEVWHYKSSLSPGPPSITGDNLMFMQTLTGALQALRIDNGALQWTYKDPWGVAQVFPDIDGILYLETGDGFIVALRANNGTRLWHVRPLPPPFTFGSVQAEDDIVYTVTTVGVAQDQTITALKANDGSLIWRHNIGTSTSNISPQIINGRLYTDSGSTITVSRASDGMVLWHANYAPTTSQYSSSFLDLEDDLMIIRSSDNTLEAHQLDAGTIIWRYSRKASS